MPKYINLDYYCENVCKCNANSCDKEKCPLWAAPACDVVEVVRCKDCKYSRELNKDEKVGLSKGILICKSQIATNNRWHPVWSNYFCGCGERKEDVK